MSLEFPLKYCFYWHHNISSRFVKWQGVASIDCMLTCQLYFKCFCQCTASAWMLWLVCSYTANCSVLWVVTPDLANINFVSRLCYSSFFERSNQMGSQSISVCIGWFIGCSSLDHFWWVLITAYCNDTIQYKQSQSDHIPHTITPALLSSTKPKILIPQQKWRIIKNCSCIL